jgi:uncharacterized protein
MALDPQLQAQIISRIRSVSQPSRIILFGSVARGQDGPDSDVDLLILTSEDRPLRSIRAEIRRALLGLERPIDLLLMRPDRFEETRGHIGGIARPASLEGSTIYEAA